VLANRTQRILLLCPTVIGIACNFNKNSVKLSVLTMLTAVMKCTSHKTAKNNHNLQLYFQKGLKTIIRNFFVKDLKHTGKTHRRWNKHLLPVVNQALFQSKNTCYKIVYLGKQPVKNTVIQKYFIWRNTLYRDEIQGLIAFLPLLQLRKLYLITLGVSKEFSIICMME